MRLVGLVAEVVYRDSEVTTITGEVLHESDQRITLDMGVSTVSGYNTCSIPWSSVVSVFVKRDKPEE